MSSNGIRASASCLHCANHGIIISQKNHECDYNTDTHKKVCEKCENILLPEEANLSREHVCIQKKKKILLQDLKQQLEDIQKKKIEHEEKVKAGKVGVDNLIFGTVGKKTNVCTINSSFDSFNIDRNLKFYIFILGYPIIKMSKKNFKQVKNYLKYGPLGSEFVQIQYMNLNNGIIITCCIDIVTAGILVNVINDLEFRMYGSSTPYPLVISPFLSSSPIVVSCSIDKSLSFDKLVTSLAQQNELDPKSWRYLTSKEVNNEKQIMKFCVDPKTSEVFEGKGGILKFNKKALKVIEELNPFKRDMEIVKTKIKNDVTAKQQISKLLDLIISGHRNDDWTWNFQHEISSDTTMITIHWYVGIMSGRINFSNDQPGRLKELTIHKLPVHSDGGKVLKYVIEEMGLQKFYYGKIPLILNGKKQDVKEVEANEIQIQSILEMFRQYPYIKSFRLILSATDVASDEIERVINPRTDLFKKLEEFEVIDNSRYRSVFGVFLGLLKNMTNLEKLLLKTQDRNINTLLEEFLRYMPNLNEIYLTSTAPRASERLNIIKSFVPNLRKLTVAPQFVEDAKNIFGSNVQICKISK